MNKFCTACGGQLVAGDQYCVSCGAAVPATAVALVAAGATDAQPGPNIQDAIPKQPAAPTDAPEQRASQLNEFVGRARPSVTTDLARRSAVQVTAVWVGLWLLLAVVAQVFKTIAESGNADTIGSPTLASFVMLLGFGGSAVVKGSASLGIASGTVSGWVHIVPFVIPLAYFAVLRKVQRSTGVELDRPTSVASGAISAATAALLTAATVLLANGTGFNDGIPLHAGMSWFLPLVLATLLSFLAVAGLSFLPSSDSLRASLRELSVVLFVIGGLALALGAAVIAMTGFKIGTDAISTTARGLGGSTIGYLLALPNAIAGGFAGLTGAQLSVHGTSTEAVSAVDNVFSSADENFFTALVRGVGLGDGSGEPVGLPFWAQFGVAVAVLATLLSLWNRRRQQASRRAWWQSGLVFATAGLLLSHFGSLTHGGTLSGSILGSGAEANFYATVGFNPLEVAVRVGILGIVIGLFRHPAIIVMLQPIGEPVSRFAEGAVANVRRQFGSGRIPRLFTGKPAAATTGIAGDSPDDVISHGVGGVTTMITDETGFSNQTPCSSYPYDYPNSSLTLIFSSSAMNEVPPQ